MTKLLRSWLRSDYLAIIKAKMLDQRYNNVGLARQTGYSSAQIGNLMNDRGSDDCLGAVCKVLKIDVRTELFKESEGGDAGTRTGTNG